MEPLKTGVLSLLVFIALGAVLAATDRPYPIVDTGQVYCYNQQVLIPHPQAGEAFFGQDAHYEGLAPSYKDNGDGTVTDLNTGLTWQKDPGEKVTLAQALAKAGGCRLGGHTDWRVPTIKELYSLILFSGIDPDPQARKTDNLKPFIDTRYFTFQYGNLAKGERIIDSQYLSSTRYVHKTMWGSDTLFGVNFADGRIKGYGVKDPRRRQDKTFYCLYVRGNPRYGKNDFVDNGDGTVSDKATGLMWMQVDSGHLKAGNWQLGGLDWQQALQWAEGLTYGGHSDWRVPNIKELQSIIDYSHSPDTTGSGAMDPVFKVSSFKNEGGKADYPFYWSSSTHANPRDGAAADYMAVGRALGWMKNRRTGTYSLLDVHGAGAQRSDPKSGDPGRFPRGRGPQGDVIRIYNFVRCVRGGAATLRTTGPALPKGTGQTKTDRKEGQQGGRPPFVQRLDKNGDGKVSKNEFDGPRHHFSSLDTNGDGYLSEDEAPKGPPKGKGRGRK